MKPATLTLKIINDQDVLDTFSKEKVLTEDQKDLIRLVAREAVQDYVRTAKTPTPMPAAHDHYSNPDRMVRLPEVVALTGLSRASIYKHIHEGRFPKQIQLGPRSVGWKESHITAWREEREALSIQANNHP